MPNLLINSANNSELKFDDNFNIDPDSHFLVCFLF